MKAVGIVAEYDPFHNGHYYHIAQSKTLSEADVVICVLSGDFVQRGNPSFYDKYARTSMALAGGADIVVMLPFAYSCQTAEIFAFGALRILHDLGCAVLSFGSECADVDLLCEAAKILSRQDHHFSPSVKAHLASGRSFAKSRQLTLSEQNPTAAALLNSPNNILAIEYLKQILLHRYPITPYAVQRVSVSHDESIIEGSYSSASHIRRMITGHDESFTACVPAFTVTAAKALPYNLLENYKNILYQNLLTHTRQSLCAFPDITAGLANKMKKHLDFFADIQSYIDAVSDKRYAKSRISRSLCHMLLNFRFSHAVLRHTPPPYIRLLGFSERGKSYLNALTVETKIISNVKDAYRKAKSTEKTILDCDLLASDIYQLGIGGQKGIDYRMKPIFYNKKGQ